MTNQIICPKCRRLQVPLEDSGQLICPACASILPSNMLLPEVSARSGDRGVKSAGGMGFSPSSGATSSALDDPAPQSKPVGAMTLLRKDLRTNGDPPKQSGWLDNVMARRSKAASSAMPSTRTNPRELPEPKGRVEAPTAVPSLDSDDFETIEAASTSTPRLHNAPATAPALEPEPATDELPQLVREMARESRESKGDRIMIAPIATLLGFAGLTILGLLQNQILWTSLLLFATTVLLSVAILGAYQRRDARKAFWQGFAVFGWAYLAMAFLPYIPYQAGVEVPSSPLLKWVHARATSTPVDSRDTFQILKETSSLLPARPDSEMMIDVAAAATTKVAAAGFFAPGDVNQFVIVGHCLFTLLAGLAGSAVAQWFHRTRHATN